jgi:hypothetical protein
MGLFRKKSVGSGLMRSDALGCTPLKNESVVEMRLDTGEMVLTYPVQLRPWIGRLFGRFSDNGTAGFARRLQLDTLGTQVWDLMDRRQSVDQLIDAFARMHQLQRREAEVSVTRFLYDLGRRGIIGIG